MKMIIALGNPGKEYQDTRHNIAFYFLDEYLKSKGQSIVKEKYNGLYGIFTCDEEKLLYLKPMSYMNVSGTVIKKFVNYYKIDLEDILIIVDDVDTEVGSFRLKSKGSSGGHKGLQSIEKALKTQNYKRLRIGISLDKKIELKDYVLGKISQKDKKIYEDLKPTINALLDDYIDTDFEKLSSKYNKK